MEGGEKADYMQGKSWAQLKKWADPLRNFKAQGAGFRMFLAKRLRNKDKVCQVITGIGTTTVSPYRNKDEGRILLW
jgi:hypothetical protein